VPPRKVLLHNYFFYSYKITTFENKTSNNLENYKPYTKTGADRFLILLKTRGPLAVSVMASELKITGEAVRLQLLKLAEEGLVEATSSVKGVGRPVQMWNLTPLGNAHFPDMHAELTLQLLQTIQHVLGPEALEHVVAAREQRQMEKYSAAIAAAPDTESKIALFATIRSREGYLAEWRKEEEGYIFIENHCPICAAATQCDNICKSELKTFSTILGNEVEVSRIDHIVAGARRCAYKIVPVKVTSLED
jgi:predicted ArsR family transcriptional regulator